MNSEDTIRKLRVGMTAEIRDVNKCAPCNSGRCEDCQHYGIFGDLCACGCQECGVTLDLQARQQACLRGEHEAEVDYGRVMELPVTGKPVRFCRHCRCLFVPKEKA